MIGCEGVVNNDDCSDGSGKIESASGGDCGTEVRLVGCLLLVAVVVVTVMVKLMVFVVLVLDLRKLSASPVVCHWRSVVN